MLHHDYIGLKYVLSHSRLDGKQLYQNYYPGYTLYPVFLQPEFANWLRYVHQGLACCVLAGSPTLEANCMRISNDNHIAICRNPCCWISCKCVVRPCCCLIPASGLPAKKLSGIIESAYFSCGVIAI